MTSTDMEERKSGISRRDLIKKGAVAGAVFWSVPVIESITSRAAAQSGCVTFNASWIYVIWKYNGTYYYTGYKQGDSGSTCTASSYPDSKPDVSIGPCDGYYWKLLGSQGTPPELQQSATSDFASATDVTYLGQGSCGTYLRINGGEVTPFLTGVQIVAAFCFGGTQKLTGTCVGDNAVCANCD